jgi:hypothetical protein
MASVRVGLRVLVLAAVAALPWGGSAMGEAPTIYYGRVQVDIGTLTLSLDDPLPLLPRPARRHFVRFTDGWGRHEVSDCEDPESRPVQVCYNLFNLDPDYRLLWRTKHQRLLAGEFGTVYGFITYWYGPQYGDHPHRLMTYLYVDDLRQELPREGPPPDPPPSASSLSAVSVVRVLRAPPGALVASANYARDGHLYALHVNGSRQGVLGPLERARAVASGGVRRGLDDWRPPENPRRLWASRDLPGDRLSAGSGRGV